MKTKNSTKFTTGTGGGAESSGGEVASRQNPGGDEDGRNRQSVTEGENT